MYAESRIRKSGDIRLELISHVRSSRRSVTGSDQARTLVLRNRWHVLQPNYLIPLVELGLE